MASNSDVNGQKIIGKKPELHISKFIALKLRKQKAPEVIKAQLQKVLKVLISIGKVRTAVAGSQPDQSVMGPAEPITDFGIRAIDYK